MLVRPAIVLVPARVPQRFVPFSLERPQAEQVAASVAEDRRRRPPPEREPGPRLLRRDRGPVDEHVVEVAGEEILPDPAPEPERAVVLRRSGERVVRDVDRGLDSVDIHLETRALGRAVVGDHDMMPDVQQHRSLGWPSRSRFVPLRDQAAPDVAVEPDLASAVGPIERAEDGAITVPAA